MSGCVNWAVPIGFNLHRDCTPSGVVNFQLFLYDTSKQVRNNKRTIATRGPAKFSTQPVTAGGVAYAGAIPLNSTPGDYPAPKEGGENNPDNLVAGELDMTFNPNTGSFEAGTTQILARLLTDVAGAALNHTPIEKVHDLTSEELSATGDFAMSNFTVGEAMPVSVHNNNPYEFGPTFVAKNCAKETKHTIRVVNRAPKSFPAGQLVMCLSLIHI